MRLAILLVGSLVSALAAFALAFAMGGGPRQDLKEQTGLVLCRSGQVEPRPDSSGAARFELRSGARKACKAAVLRSLARAASDQCPDPSARRRGCSFGFGSRTVRVIRFESRRGSDRYLVSSS